MARPERNNVDYFPFICKEGKVMFFIEEKYGNNGFATWVKILRQLAVTNYHYLNLKEKIELMFLSSKCKVDEITLVSIINDLCEMGEFHKELWFENRIIFSEKFVDHIEDAYFKRNNKCINLLSLFHLLNSLGIRKPSNKDLKGVSNPQRKEEKKKEEIEEPKKGVRPSVSEVIDFFFENSYSSQAAKKAFDTYNKNNWKDTKGNEIKDWKVKMQKVWFKPDNEIVKGYSPQLTN